MNGADVSELEIDPIIVVLRLDDADAASAAVEGLLLGGVRTVEITMTIPSALDIIARFRTSDAMIGAGTVLTAAQARNAVAAGARFLVAPDTSEEVLAAGAHLAVPVVPGALTPTEIRTAVDLGASAVKVFPIDAVGGPEYIRSLRGPLPHVSYVVSGGVTVAQAPAYFAAGVRSVCMGREFLDRAEVASRDTDAIARRAERVLAALSASAPSA
jgi:2-dehydro-3-deoxyphosphogluconate aldolase / (4S)-4-hydroxy-2-oxoglutarate aldolase